MYDPKDGVSCVEIHENANRYVTDTIYSRRNEFLSENGEKPTYLLISSEDVKRLIAHLLYLDNNRYYGVQMHTDDFLRSLESDEWMGLGLRVVVRPGPIEVKGSARFEFLYGMRSQAVKLE